jgi:xylulokinase
LGVAIGPGDIVVSIGTSGTAFAVHDRPTADPTGSVAGFADATGRFLPLVCTLNAAPVLTAVASMLGTDLAGLDDLALAAPAGAEGVVLVPYFEGERTPNRPSATGTIAGLRLRNATAANLARAAVEGVLCGLADGVEALGRVGVAASCVVLVGGGARSRAVQAVAGTVFGCPVVVPAPREFVADGAARQAAWALTGQAQPPVWGDDSVEARGRRVAAAPAPHIRLAYAEARDR